MQAWDGNDLESEPTTYQQRADKYNHHIRNDAISLSKKVLKKKKKKRKTINFGAVVNLKKKKKKKKKTHTFSRKFKNLGKNLT